METKNNHFKSDTFQNIWKKHFIQNEDINSYDFIEGISFYKNSFPPVYFNVGKNLTKGNAYTLNNEQDFKNKTFVVYDVLPHLTKNNDVPKRIGVLKSVQYPGFLIELEKFKDNDDYLLKTFSKNTRMKMRKFTRRLEECFNITTKMFYGDIQKEEYNKLFEDFSTLMEKRYSDKQIYNNNMQPSEWNFYKDVAYPLILEKQASLFVIYDDENPIAITYNYHTEDTLIDAITVFDIDYYKFNIGYVNNLKLLNWCFENNIKNLDFSKGYFDYKKRMCTLEYDFEYHIIYDKSSIKSKLLAHCYHNFLEFKTYLRSKNFNVKLHKFTYALKNRNKTLPITEAEVIELESLPKQDTLHKIDAKKDSKYAFLTKYINDFLYLTVKSYNDINVFKVKNNDRLYIISCETLVHQITIHDQKT